MSQSLGLWMLVTAGATIVLTGLPAWMVLVAVSVCFTVLGLLAGVLSLPLLTALPLRLLGLLESDLLQALPLYVLMGAALHRMPLADLLYRAGLRVSGGGARGGALSGLGLGVLLAPMSGSVGASVAMLSEAVHPRLAASGMDPEKSAALLTVASTLGVVIPPSLVLILLGDAMLRAHTEAINITHQAQRIINTQDIFHGALLPAGLLLSLYLLITWFRAPASTAAPAAPALSARQWLTAALTLLVIVGLLSAVTLGQLYAVEAAATGALLLFVFGLADGSLDRPRLTLVLRDTMAVSGALFALLVAATSFTLVVRAFGTDSLLASWLLDLPGGRYGALLAVLGGLALCALVLDAFEMIFMVIPIVMPQLLVIVPDAPWVAVLTLFVLQASFMAPPVGYAVLLLRQRLAVRLPHRALARALAPYLAAQALVVAALLIWPGLVWREAQTAAAPVPAGVDLQQQLEQQDTR